MMGWAQHIGRDDAPQPVFHLTGCFARCEARAIADTENMGVDRHGILSEYHIEDDIRRFSPHPGEGFKLFTCGGDVTIMKGAELMAKFI
ncbi:hypothetical protein DOFOFD_02395 [Acetobacteraceae bacterium EV16P]|uniref:Uncharacterized protein n=1 Tax=Sorlinia euscelidii TaxID=3081148 RepID=A0ABU7U0A2_9PROT